MSANDIMPIGPINKKLMEQVMNESKPQLPEAHFMVDIETTGLDSSQNEIIQLAAQRFDPFDPDAEVNDFTWNEFIYPGMSTIWDESTREWHMDKMTPALIHFSEAYEAEAAGNGMSGNSCSKLLEFACWVNQHCIGLVYNENELPQELQPVFWAKPVHFDFAFVQGWMRNYRVTSPFHYRHTCDMRSFIAGLQAPQQVELPEVSWNGVAHDAMADVDNQVRVVQEAVRNARERFGAHYQVGKAPWD